MKSIIFALKKHKNRQITMNRLKQLMVWLARIGHCRGFGIQSPTDYRFVCYVINEHWPYYAYSLLGRSDSWLQAKLGRLYFRIVNDLQPAEVVDQTGKHNYLSAASQKAKIVGDADRYELAFVPVQTDWQQVLAKCGERSMVVFEGIYSNWQQWKRIIADERVTIAYDLYYCGIVTFDPQRTKQTYKINF